MLRMLLLINLCNTLRSNFLVFNEKCRCLLLIFSPFSEYSHKLNVNNIHVMAGAKPSRKGAFDYPYDPPNFYVASPGPKSDENEEHQDIDIDDLFGSRTPEDEIATEEKDNAGVDINVPHQNDTDEEIADVDDSGDEAERGPNAAEALRAQVNAEERDEQTSSSSSSSGSGSSSSSSSSSDSDGSDEDSVNSI